MMGRTGRRWVRLTMVFGVLRSGAGGTGGRGGAGGGRGGGAGDAGEDGVARARGSECDWMKDDDDGLSRSS